MRHTVKAKPTIYVDDCRYKIGRNHWSHLFCVPHDEKVLLGFMQKIRLSTKHKLGNSVSITDTTRNKAIKFGAKECTVREAIRLINAHDYKEEVASCLSI